MQANPVRDGGQPFPDVFGVRDAGRIEQQLIHGGADGQQFLDVRALQRPVVIAGRAGSHGVGHVARQPPGLAQGGAQGRVADPKGFDLGTAEARFVPVVVVQGGVALAAVGKQDCAATFGKQT